MERGSVDLRTCIKGDILISVHGKKLRYIKPVRKNDYYDHYVEYLDINLGRGSRTHDGYVFRKNRVPETDDDIVKIIRLRKQKLDKINKKL